MSGVGGVIARLEYLQPAFILREKSFVSRWLQVLNFIDIHKGLGVASITIEIPDTQLQKLQQLAQGNGISLEDLLRAIIEDWLSQHICNN